MSASVQVPGDWLQDATPLEKLFDELKSAQTIPKEVPTSEPVGGVDIRCGPILRLLGTHENGKSNYRASILIVSKDESSTTEPKITFIQGPTIPQGTSNEFLQGEFPRVTIHKESGYTFWRFSVELELKEFEQKVRYNILDTVSYEFFLPSDEQPMNVISHSCNGFSLATETKDFKGSLWFDVTRTHYKENRYHVMLGGGDQVYCDAIKISSGEFEKWLGEKNVIKKHNQQLTDKMASSFEDFYLNQYLSWFGKGFWVGKNGSTLQPLFPFAMASIPSMNIYDDHDIIDGYGSYHNGTMSTKVFKGLGRIAFKYYMLFQHQTSVEDDPTFQNEPSWILGKTPGPYMEQRSHSVFAKLGKGIGFLGLDCRTERTLKRIVTRETLDIVFHRLEKEVKNDPSIKHILVLLGVPIAYPRLVWLEWLLSSRILYPFRKMSEKGVIAKGLVNEFDGSVEVLDDLNDHWCSGDHKKERNEVVAKLQKFGASNGIRITILSGDVHLAALGRFRTKLHHHWIGQEKYEDENSKVMNEPEKDPRLMFNIISSAICNAPPPDAMASLLNKRSKVHHFSRMTDEDMVPIFTKDVDGENRSNEQFLNKRNWADLIHIKNFNPTGDKAGYEIGTSKIPCQDTGLPKGFEPREGKDLAYKITKDSLIARIHVEKNHGDIESETANYEVVIPELEGTYQLKQENIKHINI